MGNLRQRLQRRPHPRRTVLVIGRWVEMGQGNKRGQTRNIFFQPVLIRSFLYVYYFLVKDQSDPGPFNYPPAP